MGGAGQLGWVCVSSDPSPDPYSVAKRECLPFCLSVPPLVTAVWPSSCWAPGPGHLAT